VDFKKLVRRPREIPLGLGLLEILVVKLARLRHKGKWLKSYMAKELHDREAM